MDWLISFWSELTGFIAKYGLLAVAPIVVLTSAGVPLPQPADILVMLMGVQAREGQHPLWLAWLLLSTCSFVGALLYEFSRWIGQGRLEHVALYGRFVGLNEHRLKEAEGNLRAWGQVAIFVGRLVPFLRMPIVAACGALNIPRPRFLQALALASLVYMGSQLLLLGYVFNPPVIAALEQIVIPFRAVVPFIAVGILLVWWCGFVARWGSAQ